MNIWFFFIQKKFQADLSTRELNAQSKAANIVDEVLSGIRTVFAFGGEKHEVERYKEHLLPAEKIDQERGILSCIEDASMYFLSFFSCAVTFWFGVQWVLDDRDKIEKAYTTSVFITVQKTVQILNLNIEKFYFIINKMVKISFISYEDFYQFDDGCRQLQQASILHGNFFIRTWFSKNYFRSY